VDGRRLLAESPIGTLSEHVLGQAFGTLETLISRPSNFRPENLPVNVH
jgi:hypothetical protein